jgi:hypothetical protein
MPTAMYYARVKDCGKRVRRKLKTDVDTKALLRLSDFLKNQRAKVPRSDNASTTFAEARLQFEKELEARQDLQPPAEEYRRGCIKALLKTWPGLDDLKLLQISETSCNEWAMRFSDAGYDSHISTRRFSHSDTFWTVANSTPISPRK